ncbi:putative zinc knuckle transcription factor (CnjB) [Fonsecaea pedrosoi]|nr:putative zinc knuckle transcription factor (CnjB) [Fonsecaea pedrosoi]
MSGWDVADAQGASVDSGWNDDGAVAMPPSFDNAFGSATNGDGMNGDDERKMGACFNCGEEGHSKAACPHPRQFKGECRNCGQEGHMAADCPSRVIKCKNCQQEGHEALKCTNPKFVDNTRVADKTEGEAWALLKEASDDRDIVDFKEALQILSKAAPGYTYPMLEKEFRKRGFNIYLIAMEKDLGDTWTNVNLQGEIEKKYAISYFTSDKPQRPTLLDRWPSSPEDNLARLADAGIPLDRGVDKCNNCGKIGHITKRCPEERIASVQPTVTCYLCGEEGHRVRDCGQERKHGARACKICESEEHLAKDCPNKEQRTCRNCGEEDHMARDCPTREKRTCRNCGDEDHLARDCPQPRKMTCNICSEEGHMARECPKREEAGPRPRTDWTKVTCTICNEKGHGRARCPQNQAALTDRPNDGKANGANSAADVGAGWDSAPVSDSAAGGWDGAQNGDSAWGGVPNAAGGAAW